MSHLTEEELLDLAEGTPPADPVERDVLTEHLRTCAVCRRQFEDARSMLATAAEIGIVEPSPFFWEQLSRRVRESIAAESPTHGASPRRSVLAGFSLSRGGWGWAGAAAAAAILIVAAVITVPRSSPSGNVGDTTLALPDTAATGATVTDVAADSSDAPLNLIVDLAGDLSWDDASEAGLMTRRGTVDAAISELTAEERLELQRLLQEQLSQSGSKVG